MTPQPFGSDTAAVRIRINPEIWITIGRRFLSWRRCASGRLCSIIAVEGRKYFRDFLRTEFSEENVLFWLACEELKRETNAELVEEKARSIYEDYISILSPKEVRAFHLSAF